jgi:hypothetical protein
MEKRNAPIWRQFESTIGRTILTTAIHTKMEPIFDKTQFYRGVNERSGQTLPSEDATLIGIRRLTGISRQPTTGYDQSMIQEN